MAKLKKENSHTPASGSRSLLQLSLPKFFQIFQILQNQPAGSAAGRASCRVVDKSKWWLTAEPAAQQISLPRRDHAHASACLRLYLAS